MTSMTLPRAAIRLLISALLALAVTVSAGITPARAAPKLNGDYASMSSRLLAPIMEGQSNRDLIQIDYAINLDGIAAELASQGYTYRDDPAVPIVGKLDWLIDYTVWGPGKYYRTGSFHDWAPALSNGTWKFAPSSSNYDGGKVLAGPYKIEFRIEVSAHYLGSPAENAWPYDSTIVYTKTLSQDIAVPGVGNCSKVSSKVKKAKAKVKSAHGKKAKKRAKAKLRNAKAAKAAAGC